MPLDRQQPPALYLLLLALALLAWCLPDLGSFTTALPKIMLSVLALGLILTAYHWQAEPLRPDWKWLLLLAVALYCFFYLFYTRSNVPGQLGIYPLKYVAALQLTLIVLIIIQWYCQPSPYFNWLAFSIGFLLLSSGIMPPSNTFKGLYSWLVLSFMGLFSLGGIWPQLVRSKQAQMSARRKYLLQMMLVLALASLVGLSSLRLFEAADRQLNTLLSHFFMRHPTDWSGFSGQTRLKGQQEIRLSEKIALRVHSPQALTYWRGNILSFYREGDWYPEETLHRASGEADLRQDDNSGEWMRPYRIDSRQAASESFAVQIESLDHYNGILFLPAEAQVLLAPQEARLYRNQYGLLRRELFASRHSYEMLASLQRQTLASFDAEVLQENLRIDSDIAALLRPLARAVTATGRTDLEKARLLESWFQTHFTYSLQSEAVTPGMDPTVDFVLNRKPAWCSWFASGMVLMLRSLNIPAHLVSGWRDMEYNPLGQYWVIREKSAHDWVEVLDVSQNTWVTFDPTPAAQLAALQQSNTPLWLRQTYEATQAYWQQWRQRLEQMPAAERWQWLQQQVLKLLNQPLGWLLLAAAGFSWLRHRRHRRAVNNSSTQKTSVMAYRGGEAIIAETLGHLSSWFRTRNLPPPEQDIDSWLSTYQAQLSPEEQKALKAVWHSLESLRFGPPDPLMAERLPKQLRHLQRAGTQRPSA